MNDNWLEKVSSLMGAKQYGEAIVLLKDIITNDASNWNAWYLIGQCFRFLNDFDEAVECLKRASELARDHKPAALLALGIAYQLKGEFSAAIEAFTEAIGIDQNYALAYNSLALTYKRLNQYELSAESYKRGIQALTRKFVLNLNNEPSNRIFKHQNTPSTLWVEYATWGAAYLACVRFPNSTSLLLPSGSAAQEEELNETHKGLYWVEQRKESGEPSCYVLPNFFNTFREYLKGNNLYATMTGNRALVLELLGKTDEAESHFREANYFESK